MNCPLCNQPLNSSYQKQGQTVFAFSLGEIAMQPGSSATKQTPAREPNLQSDVIVPVLQTLASGLFAGVLVASACRIANRSDVLVAGVGSGALCCGIVWTWLLREQRELLWSIETITGRDIDNDGFIGQPAPEPRETLVPTYGPSGALKSKVRKTTTERFSDFVRGCEKNTAQNYWEENGMDRNDYIRWRDLLISLGWARWNTESRNQGWTLAFTAKQIIDGLWSSPAIRRRVQE